MYTTGTTRTPKGVLITEGNLAAMTAMLAGVFSLTPNSRYLALLPMFQHQWRGDAFGGLTAGGRVALSSGTTAAAIFVISCR